MVPYAVVDYELFTMGIGQPYARVENPSVRDLAFCLWVSPPSTK